MEKTEQLNKEISKAESYLNGNYSQYDKDGAYDDLIELRAELKGRTEAIKEALEIIDNWRESMKKDNHLKVWDSDMEELKSLLRGLKK